MVVEQHGRFTIAPLCPSRHEREHLVCSLHEVVSVHHVERILEVDLQQPQLRSSVLVDRVSKGVSYYLHSTFTPYTVVLALESITDLFFGSKTKTLPTNRRMGSPHANGRTAVADFSSAIDTPPAINSLRNSGPFPRAK